MVLAARPAATALLLALAAVATAAGVAGEGWRASVLWAESNQGLRPRRLEAYGRTHYYQISEQAVGTLVSRASSQH